MYLVDGWQDKSQIKMSKIIIIFRHICNIEFKYEYIIFYQQILISLRIR